MTPRTVPAPDERHSQEQARLQASAAPVHGTPPRVNWDALALLVLFFSSFALYARTAAPGVLDGDFGEFQTNIFKLGVSHTGYPLYFLLGKLWTLLVPAGSIAYRANVFSGLWGALTLVLIYAFMRTLSERRAVALLVALWFGVSRVFWSQAVIPDVYTLNAFFVVLVLWLAVLWRAGRVPLWWLSLAYGLALTHHRTMLLLAPALALFVLPGAGRALLQPRLLVVNAAALLLPLLLYLYIPLRGASDVGVEYHPGSNVNLLALNVFYDLRFGPPGFLWERVTQLYLPLLVEQFTAVGFALGIGGIVALALGRVPRGFPSAVPPLQLLLLVGLAHLAASAFAICFWVFDSEIFFIPSFIAFLLFCGIGLAVALDVLEKVARSARSTGSSALIAQALLVAALALVPAWLLGGNFPRSDQSGNDQADLRWQEILAQPLERGAIIMAPWEDLTPLEYYQYVEGRRTDLQRRKIIIYSDQLKLAPQGKLAPEIRRDLNAGKAVYLTRHPSETETLDGLDRFDLVPYATLWRIQPRRRMDSIRAGTNEDDGLSTWAVAPDTPRAGQFVTLLCRWADPTLAAAIRLVLRLRDAAGNLWVESESLPFGGRDLQTIARDEPDLQGLFIPPDAPPGAYTLELAAYERESQSDVPIVGDSSVVTATLAVAAPSSVPPLEVLGIAHPVDAALGSARLVGYALSAPEPRGGDLVELDTWWQGLARRDDALAIQLRDAAGAESVLYQGALVSANAAELDPTQIVRARHTLTIPPTAAPGYADITLTYDGASFTLRHPLGASTRRFRVPIIRRPQLTLVGEAIQLLGYELNRTELRPGDELIVTLYWSANAAPEQSYKVFVHLLDGSGVLRTQRDAIPQNGALPTNRWFAGEYVTDPYTLKLPPDLAPGEYRLVVGMYDETTGARVPLTDPQGARLADDRVFLNDVIRIR